MWWILVGVVRCIKGEWTDSAGSLEVTTLFVSVNTAAGLAWVFSRWRSGGDHHARLPQRTSHRTGQWTQEIHLVLWLHPLLHHSWGRPTQPTHPAPDSWRWWAHTNASWECILERTLLPVSSPGNSNHHGVLQHVFSSVFSFSPCCTLVFNFFPLPRPDPSFWLRCVCRASESHDSDRQYEMELGWIVRLAGVSVIHSQTWAGSDGIKHRQVRQNKNKVTLDSRAENTRQSAAETVEGICYQRTELIRRKGSR